MLCLLVLNMLQSCVSREEILTRKIQLSADKVEGYNSWLADNKFRLNSVERNEILSKDITLQKAIFTTISPEARYRMWIDKLNALDTSDMTPQQKMFIKDVKNSLTPDMFDFKNKNYATTYKYFDFVKTNSIKIFGADSAARIFSNLSDTNNFIARGIPLDPVTVACECSTKSDWCSCGPDPYHCAYCQNPSCSGETNYGCGAFWSYACNGSCSQSGYKE